MTASGEVEDEEHSIWLMRCEAWESQCVKLEEWICNGTASDKCSTQDPAVSLLSAACTNYELLAIISCLWHARFG